MSSVQRLVRRAAAAGVVLGVACAMQAACRPQQTSARGQAEEATGEESVVSGAASAGCADASEQRSVFFGDLHVHTAFSFDAWAFGTRLTPSEAYAFARGEEVRLPPLDGEGAGTRATRLPRPLDFAAVTDHSELLGETSLCSVPGSPVYDSEACAVYRDDRATGTNANLRMFALGQMLLSRRPTRLQSLCGPGGSRCEAAASAAWEKTIQAAERWNDPCDFTTFIGYEYTGSPAGHNLHRNVIFRGSAVPASPVTYIEEPTPQGLWRALRAGCSDAGSGCDVLAIPHNSNISHGRMFAAEYPGASTTEEQARQAALRAEMEPLVEIMQIKGDSECRNGLGGVLGAPDELCDFEKLPGAQIPVEECAEGTYPALGDFDAVEPGEGDWESAVLEILATVRRGGCVSRLDYVRYALVEGLREADRLGANPFKLGIIAGTDIHDGTPGAVEESRMRTRQWLEDNAEASGVMSSVSVTDVRARTPGGVAAVWARENSRDAIFAALRRRETYGTSGPRMVVRFFGGWSYPEDLCADPEMVARAYAGGVPMGGDLPVRRAGDGAPVFVVSALRDPGTEGSPGGLLQRLQVVKGWVDDEGRAHQAVFDVAGSAENGAIVDLDTCEPKGPGFDSLCTVWRDPEFDAGRRTLYYARIVENPSCRWNAYECLGGPNADLPAHCAEGDVEKTTQERAWTSPIWYDPSAGRSPATSQGQSSEGG